MTLSQVQNVNEAISFLPDFVKKVLPNIEFDFKKINDLLLELKVIFFRDQPLTTEQHIALAAKFGPLETHAYVKGRSEFPEIVRIIKKPDEKTQWGEGWHSDVSYNKKPTKAVVLKSIKIPPVGGDTVFSNMELAWEPLEE